MTDPAAGLEALLALLPDNDVGAITAADMRAVVTALWDYTEAIQKALNTAVVDGFHAADARMDDIEARLAALEGAAG